LNFGEFQLVFIGGNKVSERMLADDGVFGAAQQRGQFALGPADRVVETLAENRWITDAPAGIDGDDDVVTVLGERLLEFFLEVLDALVEWLNFLNWPGQLEIKTRFRDGSAG